MTSYDAFPFDSAAWFPQQHSPAFAAAHTPDAALDSAAGVFAPGGAAPWSLDPSVPPWPAASSACQLPPAQLDLAAAPGAQSVGAGAVSSFLSPLPLPNLSLGPAPGDVAGSSAAGLNRRASSASDVAPQGLSDEALRALIGASPLMHAGEVPDDVDGEHAERVGAGAAAGDGLPGHGDADFANMHAATYAQLIQQARSTLFGTGVASPADSATPSGASPSSTSLAPASTYITAPSPSSIASPAASSLPPASNVPPSVPASALSNYGLSLSMHHAVQQPHAFAPPLSLHLNAPPATSSPVLSQHGGFGSSAAPASYAAVVAGHATGGAAAPEDGDAFSATGESGSESGSGSESDDEDDEMHPLAGSASGPSAFGAHIRGAMAEDHLTPATSAHHSDHEGTKGSPAGSGSLLFGIAPPSHLQPSSSAAHAMYYAAATGADSSGAYDPGAPYIPFLRNSSLSSASSRSLSAGSRYAPTTASTSGGTRSAATPASGVTYRDDDPPELPYLSDDSADGTFGKKPGPAQRAAAAGGGSSGHTRGRARTRKPSAAAIAAAQAGQSVAGLNMSPGGTPLGGGGAAAGFASPRPAAYRSGSVSSSGGGGGGGLGGGGGSKKRNSPGSDVPPASERGPGASIDPVTGLTRRQTEIPAVEDDPSIRPYGCNWCRLERDAEAAAAIAAGASPSSAAAAAGKGKARATDELDEDGRPILSWRTIKELREHAASAHKERAIKAKGETDEAIMMEMPFCCALDPCGKTFKSLAGLRFHFQNASANGHFFVQLERDAETGEERATKKFKQEVKPSGRELKCPVGKCPKRFKQSAGLAYHLSHTANHPITESMLATFEPTLQSKTRWWFARLNKQFEKA
ncbi:hypothetical protein Rhopal_003061-T1 [Rhodotorula paludigena]|uniref:C2H2-type domain-containing protein n=1 Tax=Rhodotorula paludigena TaxID=86838 RepID=A0AAV5GIM8_9BASI|nr:hypothetical protein Rhopal_003061-T1 [Rhodotorula paludigena]